jgi:hypothetical protein
MFRFFSLLGLCVAVVLVSGCNKTPKDQSVPVQGQVNLDGKPMSDGDVYFSLQGMPPSVMAVTNGTYSGQARVGQNRVEVRAYKVGPPISTDPDKKPTKLNYLPPKWNAKSELTADVKAGAANEFKFDVTSN